MYSYRAGQLATSAIAATAAWFHNASLIACRILSVALFAISEKID